MAKTAVITTRIEPELKTEVETVLNELGLTMSQAILLYLKQIALQQGIPFQLQTLSATSNPATLLDLAGIIQSGYRDTSTNVKQIVAESVLQK
ncbi:MAG: type II toxin-antitoxin system RelB/DinJ family antitoxin [Chloroflexi bacterium]|nr:type II toxin-antitoxin system RelB/DinJ family antitoxin [Chloroflexota bacterium]